MALSTGTKGGNTRKKAAKRGAGGGAAAGKGKKAGRGRGAGAPGLRAKQPTLNGIGSAAVEKATGRGWAEWVEVLDRDGGAAMTHKEIAIHLHEKHGVREWWSQMVTVGYEHAKGRRARHERPDGYEVSVNKTVTAPVAAVIAAFTDLRARARWLPGEKFEVRGVTPGKAVRITWGDGTNVVVGFYGSTKDKARVSVQHGRLKGAREAERCKAFWRERLDALKAVL
jgi:hypothetical protein